VAEYLGHFELTKERAGPILEKKPKAGSVGALCPGFVLLQPGGDVPRVGAVREAVPPDIPLPASPGIEKGPFCRLKSPGFAFFMRVFFFHHFAAFFGLIF
jgi:hypothetical protein